MPGKLIYEFPKSDRCFSLLDLWFARKDNPVWVYSSPLRSRLMVKVSLLILWAIIAAMVALSMASNIGWIRHDDLTGLQIIFLLTSIFIILPTGFHDMVVLRTPNQLEELYLTRLSRPEVAFGSIGPAMVHLTVMAAVIGANFSIWLYIGFKDAALFYYLLLGIAFLLFCVNYLLKILRIWFAFRRFRFMAIFLAPLTLVFDFFVFSLVFALLEIQFMSVAMMLPALIIALLLLIPWNGYLAKDWLVSLYYKEFDDTRVLSMMFGKIHRYKETTND
ncbi:MAG: hypothetical protein JJU11_07290 [Candidatus Sumerlaeia bacterium]|nr:hypothetical protein [Candidatus Sumerlaeia bacterium]